MRNVRSTFKSIQRISDYCSRLWCSIVAMTSPKDINRPIQPHFSPGDLRNEFATSRVYLILWSTNGYLLKLPDSDRWSLQVASVSTHEELIACITTKTFPSNLMCFKNKFEFWTCTFHHSTNLEPHTVSCRGSVQQIPGLRISFVLISQESQLLYTFRYLPMCWVKT